MSRLSFIFQQLVLRVKIFLTTAHAYFLEHSPLSVQVAPHYFNTAPLYPILSSLVKRGTVIWYGLCPRDPQDLDYIEWAAYYRPSESGGGLSCTSHYHALAAATAEATERSIWFTETDFFSQPIKGTSADLGSRAHINPSEWRNYTPLQQEKNPETLVTSASSFLWIKGFAWTDNTPILIPAQIVSRFHAIQHIRKDEPRLCPTITTGLATGQSRINALLGGVLEVIERDAFMILWLNELALPQLQVTSLTSLDIELESLVRDCTSKGLIVSFRKLLTDAPTHVICAVVLDPEYAPPFTLGVSAHANGAYAAKKALLEALRGRKNARNRMKRTQDHQKAKHVFNFRTEYWYDHEKLTQVSFLTNGKEVPFTTASWEFDTPQKHFDRILTWCREKKYTCASVDMTLAHKNATPWYIYFSLIPQLQPLFHDEKLPCFYNKRLREVPLLFGYTPRTEPFSAPHPFL